jgi:tetratricopeptide (TPR) repeat protein
MKKIIVGIIVSLMAANLMGFESSKTMVEEFRSGVEKLDEGKYEEGLKIFEKLSYKDKESFYLKYALGYTKMHMGNYEEALNIFKEIVNKIPLLEEAWFQIRICYEKLDKLNEARDFFENSIKNYSYLISVNYNLATVYVKLAAKEKDENKMKELISEAEKYYKKVIAIKKDYVIAYTGIGVCNYLKKDLKGAEKNFRKAIKIDKNYSQAHYLLSMVLRDNGKMDESIKEKETALKLNPELKNVPDSEPTIYLKGNPIIIWLGAFLLAKIIINDFLGIDKIGPFYINWFPSSPQYYGKNRYSMTFISLSSSKKEKYNQSSSIDSYFNSNKKIGDFSNVSKTITLDKDNTIIRDNNLKPYNLYFKNEDKDKTIHLELREIPTITLGYNTKGRIEIKANLREGETHKEKEFQLP